MTAVVETVTASKVSGDSANVRVDDVVPAVMSDIVVSVAERRYINLITMVILHAGINKVKYIAYHW